MKYLKIAYLGDDIAQRVRHVLANAGMDDSDIHIEEHDSEAECHYFASSPIHWRTHTDLGKCIERQRRADRETSKTGGFKITAASVWRVPGPEDSDYSIENYAPDVDGAEFIATIRYED